MHKSRREIEMACFACFGPPCTDRVIQRQRVCWCCALVCLTTAKFCVFTGSLSAALHKSWLIIIIIIIIIMNDKIRVTLSREITASGALYNEV